MTVFTITETYGFESASEVVAVCDSHASAIQWLIENKGLSAQTSEFNSLTFQYQSFQEAYGKEWLSVLLEYKRSFFHLDGLDYEIEEKELFSKKPLDI